MDSDCHRVEPDYARLDPKLIGRYYTPRTVAQNLVNWAVTHKDARILDPSFGGCAFFDAAIERLARFGTHRPGKHLYGVDIDPLARRYLASALRNGGSRPQFLTADFLSVRPSDLSGQFDSVVGNPPYVRHHALARKPANDFNIAGNPVRLSGLSNYWAYFVLHALRFVAGNGRLAFVLPGSFLFADYGAPVRQALKRRFGSVYMIIVGEHLFPQAEEMSVLVFAQGVRKTKCSLRIGYVHAAHELETAISNIDSVTTEIADTAHAYAKALVSPKALKVYQQLVGHPDVRPLGALASVRIGVVTGCNEFFLLNKRQVSRLRLEPSQYVPTISKQAQVPGLRVTAPIVRRLSREEEPLWLLSLEDDLDDYPAALHAYLASGIETGISDRRKCRDRDPWYSVQSSPIPDAFLPSMHFHRVHLIDNVARVTSTNTIHHISWKPGISDRRRRSIVASSVSTLFAFSAELNSRRYGGGLLKIEPSDATRLQCLNLDLSPLVLRSATKLAREGHWLEARNLIDENVLTKRIGISKEQLSAMRYAVTLLRRVRHASAV